jgi:type VI secretion system protein ImpA
MTTPILEFDALTSPIEGEQPAGFRLAADVRKKMEDARKEFEPNPDDPSGPPVPKKPDWPAIIRLATDNLSTKSKDLLAAVRLVEALAKHDGYAGVRDGLKLLRLLVSDCWDRIHPLIEEPSDIESRAGPFDWLNEPEGGAWFPTTLRHIPLVQVNGHVACLQDCQNGKIGDEPLPAEALHAATPLTAELTEEVGDCVQELLALDQALAEKMADQAPSLINVRGALSAAQTLLAHLQSDTEASTAEGSAVASPGSAAEGPTASSGPMNRAETYRQLAVLADRLAKLEPHSPIPDLLRWAVKLGGMSFRQLILEFVREPTVLADIRRQFGIPEIPDDSSPSE